MTRPRSICLAAVLVYLTGVLAAVNRTGAVLSALEGDYELTTFYNLFKSTGGSSGIPAPEFEERFNDNNVGLQYTVLAPTDTAFEKIPLSVKNILVSVAGYPLLAAILRTHILPGNLNSTSLLNQTIDAIEGFNISISQSGAILSNPDPDIGKSEVPLKQQAQLLLNTTGEPITVPATNGIIYKIDNLIDPFLTFFGESAPAADGKLPDITYDYTKTMKDLLFADNDLFNATSILAAIDSDFLYQRLDLSATGENKARNNYTVFLVPSNDALVNFGPSARQGSNAELARFLVEAGFGLEGSRGIFRGKATFELPVDVNRVANARVEKRTCGLNGCIWRVGRVIDSLYGLGKQ